MEIIPLGLKIFDIMFIYIQSKIEKLWICQNIGPIFVKLVAMKRKLFLIISFLLGFSLAKSQKTYFDSLTGIEVSFVTHEEMFPESWKDEYINGKAISLDSSEYERSKKIVSSALAKYPLEILTKNLKKIYVLNDLNFYGVNYGGTVSTDAVFLTNKGIDLNYTDHYIEQVFHEEFSSILLRNYSSFISEGEWTQCASDSISYGGTGADAIRNGKAGENFDVRINENGFLGEYATSNFENDINSFAKNLFCPKPGFWKLIDDFERLSCKLEMIVDFYSKIHEDMNEDFFRSWEK